MAVADRDLPARRSRRRVAQRRHVMIVAVGVAPDFEIPVRKRDHALVGDTEYGDVADFIEPAAHPDRVRADRVMIAGQDHQRQAGIGQNLAGAVDRLRPDLVIVEGVAGQDRDIGAERARRRQHCAQHTAAVAAVQRGDAVVIDMQVRGMDDADVTGRCFSFVYCH